MKVEARNSFCLSSNRGGKCSHYPMYKNANDKSETDRNGNLFESILGQGSSREDSQVKGFRF